MLVEIVVLDLQLLRLALQDVDAPHLAHLRGKLPALHRELAFVLANSLHDRISPLSVAVREKGTSMLLVCTAYFRVITLDSCKSVFPFFPDLFKLLLLGSLTTSGSWATQIIDIWYIK